MAIDPRQLRTGTAKPTTPTVASESVQRAEAERILLEEERVYRRGVVSVRDLIAPSAFKVEPDSVRLGGTYVRTLFVIGYPRYINIGWFAPIITMNRMLDIAMYFYPVRTAIILKQLKKKVGALEAQIISDQEKGAPRDPIRETALHDIEQLRDSLSQGTEHFFQYALYVTIYATSLEELEKLSGEVEQVFGSKLVVSKRVYFQAEQGFASTLPLNNDELLVSFNMNSSPAASSFPFISSELTSNDGVLYGINRHNNSLILFDRFSLQNGNMVVFATAGAGKSVIGDTEILIRDSRGCVRQTTIGAFVEEIGARRGFSPIDDDLDGVEDPGIEVFTFDRGLRGRWSRVSIAARKVAPLEFYRFRTKSGRCVTTTGDHNMLVLRSGQVITAKSADVVVGECVPVPEWIPEPSAPTETLHLLNLFRAESGVYVDGFQSVVAEHLSMLRRQSINPRYDRYLLHYSRSRPLPIAYFWDIVAVLGKSVDDSSFATLTLCSRERVPGAMLPAQLPVTPELMRFLGYVVSEGHSDDRSVLVTNRDPDVLRDIARCLRVLRLRSFSRRDGTVVVASTVGRALVHAVGIGHCAGDKRIPGFAFNCSNVLVSEFLRAYFEGDGGVEGHAVTATSKSSHLISDLAYLLTRFGICARLAERVKHATNSNAVGRYHLLTISGQRDLERFAVSVGFVTARKQTALSLRRGKRPNTNIDTVPVTDLFEEIAMRMGPTIRGWKQFSAIRHGAFQPSRAFLQTIAMELGERIARIVALRRMLAPLGELPMLADVIAAGADAQMNGRLWETLGASWQTMRSQTVAPRAGTVLRTCSVVGGPPLSVEELKRLLRIGIDTLGVSVREISPYLSEVLSSRAAEDSDYALLYRAAQWVWDAYRTFERELPAIVERVGRLRCLAGAPLHWDPIVAIERMPNLRERFVYDLTVDDEVFLAGHGGLFMHNSYAVKLEVLRSIMIGTDVIVIDPEMEYKHLSAAVGGTYINIALGSDAKVNPFDLPRPLATEGEEVSAEDIIRSAVITVKGLLRIMIGPFSTEEDAIMDRALIETYAKKDITPQTDLRRLTLEDMPIFQDLQQILEGMVGGLPLAERLKKYTEGTFSGLLNSPTTVEMRNKLVVFSVRDLEDELKPIAIYSIINYIWNVVRSERKRRMLVVDEAWWLMQQEDSAKFIFALVKRCRKYYMGVTTITQDVNDFLTSPYGRAIVTNSALQLLLKQSPAAIDLIQKTFLLTQGEKYLLLQSGPGEGIFFAGPKHVAVKVVASYTEDQLITTDPKQLLEIEEAKHQFDVALAEQNGEPGADA